MKQAGTGKTSSGWVKGLIFRIVLILIPGVILLFIEILLRVAGAGDNLKLFVVNNNPGYENYMMVNPQVGRKYFSKLEYTAPTNDIFLKEKPENTFRIFVMGSSVVYGFPYDRNLMFSRILHQQLADAYPDKKIEMVNTSITAINSFTLLDYTCQILKYEPDALLIYAGHNEFYGAFGIGSNESLGRSRTLTRIHIALMDIRIYQVMRKLITGAAEKLAESRTGETEGTLMKRIVADREILLNSEKYRIGMDHYRQNLQAILKKAQQRGVPVFLSELVSNVSGMEPFYSIATDTLEAAADVFEKAGMAEEAGDFESALALYYRAKDLDCIRFRASEEVNRIVDELSAEFGAVKVPMLEHFQERAENRLIGNNFMTEHVHPNIDGAFLMAEAFLSEILASRLLGEKPATIPSMAYYRRNWGYTALDSLLAGHRITLLKGFWPFVTDDSDGSAYVRSYRPVSYIDSLAFEVMRNPSLSLSGVRLDLAQRYEKNGRYEEACREYEALVRMNPYIALNYRDAARCLIQLADLPAALRYLKKSLELEDSFFARFRIGEIYLMMGDYPTAARWFEESFSLAPDDRKVNVLAKSYAAFAYSGQNDRAKAVAAELERVNATQHLRIPPKSYLFDDYVPAWTRSQVLEAERLTGEGDHSGALDILLASLEIYDSHIANRMVGELYMKLHDHGKALFYLDKVYDLFRFDPAFLHSLIMLNLASNNPGQARKYLEEIRRIDPGYKQLGILNLMLSQ